MAFYLSLTQSGHTEAESKGKGRVELAAVPECLPGSLCFGSSIFCSICFLLVFVFFPLMPKIKYSWWEINAWSLKENKCTYAISVRDLSVGSFWLFAHIKMKASVYFFFKAISDAQLGSHMLSGAGEGLCRTDSDMKTDVQCAARADRPAGPMTAHPASLARTETTPRWPSEGALPLAG